MSSVTDDVPWSNVWALYRDFSGVFHRVLADLRVPIDRRTDLVHEFLLERAPYALRSFNPNRGDTAPWLYVVFRRFAQGVLRREGRQAVLIEELAAQPADTTDQTSKILAEEIAIAWQRLPSTERRALKAYFAENGGLEAVSRALGFTRWHAKRVVLLAVARLALDLGVDVGADPADVALLARGAGDDRKIVWLAQQAGRRSSDARRAVRQVREALASLLSENQRGEPDEPQQ